MSGVAVELSRATFGPRELSESTLSKVTLVPGLAFSKSLPTSCIRLANGPAGICMRSDLPSPEEAPGPVPHAERRLATASRAPARTAALEVSKVRM